MSRHLPSTSDPIAEAIAAYFGQVEEGTEIDRDAFLERFSHLADELKVFFRDHDQMVAAGSVVGADTPRHRIHRDTELFPTLAQPPYSANSEFDAIRRFESSGPFDSFPRQFGHYVLLSLIDRGGMGVVYRARDTRLDRIVALKTMRSGTFAGPEEVARFQVETAIAAGLNHPAIVPIHEVGEIDGLQYCTMSFIDGESLAQRIERLGPLEPSDAVRLVAKIARAIDAAHRAGIVHRDLKPANILIDAHGSPYVIDFGLAKNLEDTGMTATGEILGTPAYMAPEQATGRRGEATAAADIYGLGVLLYTLIAGRPPFLGATPFEVLLQVLDREPPRLIQLRRGVSRDLDRLCRRAMSKRPTDRHPDAAKLADDLERCLRDEPIVHPRSDLSDMLRHWWRREPILICHLTVMIGVAAIIAISAAVRQNDVGPWPIKLTLIGVLTVCFWGLQRAMLRPRLHDAACLTWAALDVLGGTTLIALADPPRGLLTMTYPLLIVASGLFYRLSWVAFMTTVCVVGFVGLVTLAPEPEFARLDFCAMFVLALIVMGMAVGSIIRRVRGLLRYCDDGG